YHIAHNLNHLLRESRGFWDLITNPFGIDRLPASGMEKHMAMMDPLLSAGTLQSVQTFLLAAGFLIAILVIQRRSIDTTADIKMVSTPHFHILPLIAFANIVTGYHLWLLMQPMIMRM
ncbi:MAG: hypothetical protein V7761_11530, partial [Amylibacter sp.]